MANRNNKACTTNEAAPAVERAGGIGDAPIPLTGREPEAVAAAGGARGGIIDSK